MGSLGNAGIVVVFDFDKTIIECDSDNWVVDGLGATDRFDELLRAVPWNAALDKILGELHEQGFTVEDIARRLKEAPIDEHVVEGIKTAHSLGCDLRVVSDANHFFIRTILEHHGILGCFSEINTNPGTVDEEGRLRVSPYHNHGCPLPSCPPNMCKGLIIERIRAEVLAEGRSRFIYLGDGKGDYCPSVKLTTTDYLMPRRNYPVWDLICRDPQAVKAAIHGWSDGEEQAGILLQLINRALSSDQDARILHSVDCTHQNNNFPSAAVPEALPKVPPVL